MNKINALHCGLEVKLPAYKAGYSAKKFHKLISKLETKGYFSLLPAALAFMFLIKIAVSGLTLKFDMRGKRYPSNAVEFIQKNKIPGNMFNLYNSGGYIIWSLYPDYKVFIDGRNLNETAYFHYNQILSASTGNDSRMPLWKKASECL